MNSTAVVMPQDVATQAYHYGRKVLPDVALGGAIIGTALVLSMIAIAIALTWSFVTDLTWRNIILIILIIFAIIIIIMFLVALFRRFAGSC